MKYVCPKGLHGVVTPRPPGKYPSCPECYKEQKKRGNQRYRKRGKARREIRKRVLELFGNRCSAILENGERCFVHGATLLEIHHVDVDAGNDHPMNTVPLCRSHHREFAGRPRSAFAPLPKPWVGRGPGAALASKAVWR